MSKRLFRFPVAVVLAGLAFLTGCESVIADPNGPAPGDTAAQEALWVRRPQPDRILALRQKLMALGPEVNPDDADDLAGTAVRYSEQLARRYEMTRPIEIHNVMVNMGLRKGGLCYQLADEMFIKLRDMNLYSFDLYRAIADKDDIWHEHNTVVVTARGRPFETGVVLDAWRYAGKLRFIRVAEDHHPWKIRPRQGSLEPARAYARAPGRDAPRDAQTAAARPTTRPVIWQEDPVPPQPPNARVANTSGTTPNSPSR
jgi:hypothetical protein